MPAAPRATLSTDQVAQWLQIDPRSVARWCRRYGIQPAHRIRVGRSTITAWPVAALRDATRDG